MHMPGQNSFKDLTVIIPLSPIKNQQSVLLADLKALSDWGMEVIQCSKGSRACSLNKGAAQARGQWLWFVHADSRISERQLRALQRSQAISAPVTPTPVKNRMVDNQTMIGTVRCILTGFAGKIRIGREHQ